MQGEINSKIFWQVSRITEVSTTETVLDRQQMLIGGLDISMISGNTTQPILIYGLDRKLYTQLLIPLLSAGTRSQCGSKLSLSCH